MVGVIYYSLTGNTKKMARAIAEELGVKAMSVKEADAVPKDGILFIGSGSYGDKPGDEMAAFIREGQFTGRNVALFGTSAKGEGLEVRAMEETLKQKGANIHGSYYCKGRSFVVVNIGRPNREDLKGARKFAREMTRLG